MRYKYQNDTALQRSVKDNTNNNGYLQAELQYDYGK